MITEHQMANVNLSAGITASDPRYCAIGVPSSGPDEISGTQGRWR